MEVHPNLFDQEELIERDGKTYQILTNSITGEQSVGWWYGTAADMPVVRRNTPGEERQSFDPDLER